MSDSISDGVVKDIPLVSICIPVYNCREYIEQSVFSALDQEFSNLEILIQDNYSTDGTWEILQEIAALRGNLFLVRNNSNLGMVPNWNAVVSRAQGEFILLLSADDFLHPQFLSRCLKMFGSVDADIITTDHWLLRNGHKVQRKIRFGSSLSQGFSGKIMLFNPFSINFTIIKRNAVRRLSRDGNLFTRNLLVCDYDFWFRVAESGLRVFYLNDRLGTYRIHSSNLSCNALRMNRQAALVLFSRKKKLRARHRLIFRLTMFRFLMRQYINRFRTGLSDRRLEKTLLAEVFR